MDTLASLSMATPYLWPEGEHDDDKEPATATAIRTASQSPGFAYLQAQILLKKKSSDGDGMSDAAKRCLIKLLQEQHVELKGRPIQKTGANIAGAAATTTQSSPVATVIDDSMDDDTVLHLAALGQISLLGSILAVIHHKQSSVSVPASTTTAAVSSKHIIKEVALTVNPSRTPGLLDAREMVLAALHFLSQTCAVPSNDDDPETKNRVSLQLPLIRPLSITGDLERRSYEKAVPSWELDDILPGVAALEERFYGSCETSADYPWLSRERFLPVALRHCPDLDEFLLKATVPQQLQQKLQQVLPTTATKGKSAAAAATTTKQPPSNQKRKKAAPKATPKAQSLVRQSSSADDNDETLVESSQPAKKPKLAVSPSLKLKATADPVRSEALRIYSATTTVNNNDDGGETTTSDDDNDDDDHLEHHDHDNNDNINDNDDDDVDDEETEDADDDESE